MDTVLCIVEWRSKNGLIYDSSGWTTMNSLQLIFSYFRGTNTHLIHHINSFTLAKRFGYEIRRNSLLNFLYSPSYLIDHEYTTHRHVDLFFFLYFAAETRSPHKTSNRKKTANSSAIDVTRPLFQPISCHCIQNAIFPFEYIRPNWIWEKEENKSFWTVELVPFAHA